MILLIFVCMLNNLSPKKVSTNITKQHCGFYVTQCPFKKQIYTWCYETITMNEERLSIRVELSPEEKAIFLEVKKELMMRNNTDVVRTLIKEKYEQIQEKKQAVDLVQKKEGKE